MKKILQRLIGDDRGVTAIEYGLILALIALAMMSALIGLASTTTEMWENVSEQVVNT
ncbi:hypothetical protein ACFB49_02670 [Sphingomonas sp. DBB INV C78]|uniref:Flp family type IVb pilin n=1 Tax=Sphingomonas sp. DBB INV C78 TaxID=3349434 RepID=UPI0036D3AA0F